MSNPPESRWDLIEETEVLELLAEDRRGLVIGMQNGWYPRAWREYEKDAAGRWQYRPCWRRGQVLAAKANLDARRLGQHRTK